jgi:hypothetical protein
VAQTDLFSKQPTQEMKFLINDIDELLKDRP